MGILGRINTVIKSNLNDLLDAMSDPGKEIELLILEMEQSLKQAREEVIAVVAEARRTGSRVESLKQEEASWLARATQAVRASADDLARTALREKQRCERELAEAVRNREEQEAYARELKQSLRALEERVRDVKLRKESLKQQARVAKDGRGHLGPGKAFEDFDRIQGRIEALEGEAELTESLDGREAATLARFSELEKIEPDPKVEDALAELKRKLDGGG